MSSTLAWLDLTATDRTRMRRVFDLFSEHGTVDEMGLGTLRDGLADALFPGTSSIQTRLRYVFFVPWMYRRLERDRERAAEVRERARRTELALIKPLLDCEDHEGTIGARARGGLKRLPSAVYWSALVRWGLFVPGQSQSWYHAHFAAATSSGSVLQTADDPGIVWTRSATWHPRLPEAPDAFPSKASFALSGDEATFLRDQIAARCPGTLLSWLVTEGRAPKQPFWDEPAVFHAPVAVRETVELARRFSLHVEGAPLLYNLMLAERRHEIDATIPDQGLIESYRRQLAEWATREAEERPFDPGELWSFTAREGTRLIAPQRRFVEAWNASATGRAHEVADDPTARQLVRVREMALKTSRSRFVNEGRLLDWGGASGVGRMDFRWFRVRQLLTDLHRGLAS